MVRCVVDRVALVFSQIGELLPHGLHQFDVRFPVQLGAPGRAFERFFPAGAQDEIVDFIALPCRLLPRLQKPRADDAVHHHVVSAAGKALRGFEKRFDDDAVLPVGRRQVRRDISLAEIMVKVVAVHVDGLFQTGLLSDQRRGGGLSRSRRACDDQYPALLHGCPRISYGRAAGRLPGRLSLTAACLKIPARAASGGCQRGFRGCFPP